MEGERKKRKMEYEEEDEDEQIEKLFALIKSTRRLRDLLRGSSNGPKEKRDQKKKEEGQDKAAGGAWNPAFQPEDFFDQDDKGTSASHGAGPLKIQEEEEEEKKEDKGGVSLDLKLSL